MDARPIRCALISVFNKSGLIPLVRFLHERQIALIGSGKTAQFIREHDLPITDIASITGFKEILDGRVKTLHSHIFAGLLFDRSKPHHQETIDGLMIPEIDLVVGNLYPFAKDAADIIELIDIGGPSLLRAGAKNHEAVMVLHSPEQYEHFMAHYAEHQATTFAFRKNAAASAFAFTAHYDAIIADALSENDDENILPAFTRVRTLRYGENPHQRAAVFRSVSKTPGLDLASASSLQGKELSYNNLLDAHAAIATLRALTDEQQDYLPSACVIKHGVPCGAARAHEAALAITRAILSDEKSAFGGVIAMSEVCDATAARVISERFFEVIIAQSFTPASLEILHAKKNLRLLALSNLMTGAFPEKAMRSIPGGMLVQDNDLKMAKDWIKATDRAPTNEQWAAMDFANRIVKMVPSNAIAIASSNQLLGVGAGQPNRVQSMEIALNAARDRGFDLSQSALASDAFFPFDDSIVLAHRHGVRCIIQPGGSIRDQEIIDRANQLGLTMVFTHERHFRH